MERDGAELYAEGRPEESLSAYRRALTRDPSNRTARAAVRRIEAELARNRAARIKAVRTHALAVTDPTLRWLGQLASFIHFDRSLGNLRSRLGTQSAMQGRVTQLLAEKRVARARRKTLPKAKELELRALVRRLPAASAGEEDRLI